MKKIKEKKGITLIALIITIIVLLILAGVTISMLTGEDGILNNAKRGAEQYNIEQGKERIELILSGNTIDRILSKGEIKIEKIKNVLEGKDGIADVVEGEEEEKKITVTTDEGYIYDVIIEEDGKITIEYIGKVTGPIITKINITNKSAKSISVEVETLNADEKELIYWYKKQGDSQWQKANESKELTYTYEGLEGNQTYNIKIQIKGTEIERQREITTGELPKDTITFGEEQIGLNGLVEVNVHTTESEYILLYQINELLDDGWTEIENGGTITGLKYNDILYARLYDGINYGEWMSKTINTDPYAPIDLSKFKNDNIDLAENNLILELLPISYIQGTSASNPSYADSTINYANNLNYDFEISSTIKFINNTNNYLGGVNIKLLNDNTTTARLDVHDAWAASITTVTALEINGNIIYNNKFTSTDRSGRYAIVKKENKIYFYYNNQLLASTNYTQEIEFNKIQIYFDKYYTTYPSPIVSVQELYIGPILNY